MRYFYVGKISNLHRPTSFIQLCFIACSCIAIGCNSLIVDRYSICYKKCEGIILLVPFILERTAYGERGYDIFSALLAQRIIILDEHIDPPPASIIIAQLLFLESQAPGKDIYMYINSPGGSVVDGFAIIDTMNHIKCDVSTIVVGSAASMAAVILSSGAKGKRLALPHAEVMIHQPLASLPKKQISDIDIHVERMHDMKRELLGLLAYNCGKSYDELLRDTDRDNFMTAKQALEYGLIDKIMDKRI